MTTLTAPREAVLSQDHDVGTTNYHFDYLCCVSAVTGIPVSSLYMSGQGICGFGNQSLLLDKKTKEEIDTMWSKVAGLLEDYRCVGSGLYAEYYLESIGRMYGSMYSSVSRVLMTHVDPGENLDRIRGDVALGERSFRQSSAVTDYDPLVESYWAKFRSVERAGALLRVPHLCDSELRDSVYRLRTGLVPHRRYNTPAIRREAYSSRGDTTNSRLMYKLMAVILLQDCYTLLNIPSTVDQSDIEIDSRGVLRVPMDDSEVESAFASLWLTVDDVWSRIISIRLAEEDDLASPRLYLVTLDGIRYAIGIE